MTRIGIAVAGGLMLLATSAVAQDDNPIVFGIYYRCNQGQEAAADEAVRGSLGPIAQKHVDSGALTGWAWLSHVQGGAWRRLFVTTGTDMAAMMNARTEMVEEVTRDDPDAVAALGSACPGHDDYIWTAVSFSAADVDALGPASLSTYHACDRSREGRADEIFEEVLAPLYKKHQDLGHIASWAFYAHRSGGIFRRLETFSGADHMTLMNMQAAILQEADETNPLAMQELNQICSWHTDYMWENATQQ